MAMHYNGYIFDDVLGAKKIKTRIHDDGLVSGTGHGRHVSTYELVECIFLSRLFSFWGAFYEGDLFKRSTGGNMFRMDIHVALEKLEK